jgi:hypothetical protein
VRPTRVRLLVGVAVVAAAAGWGLARVVEASTGRLLPVPWLAPAALWLLAGAVVVWALLSRPRLLRRPGHRPMPPLVATRTAALAMASSRVGAAVGGLYAGIAIDALRALSTPAGRDTALLSALCVLGAAALVAAALWLERMCRIREDDDSSTAVRRPDVDGTEGSGSWPAPAARSGAGSRPGPV